VSSQDFVDAKARELNVAARAEHGFGRGHRRSALREQLHKVFDRLVLQRAYHRHIQIGLIAQGILQYLAVSCPRLVWASFVSWLRTIRPGLPPSELVTAAALQNSLPVFLAQRQTVPLFKKFLREHIDIDNYRAPRLAG